MITREEINDIKDVVACVKEFNDGGDWENTRLQKLDDYYKGNLDILYRQRRNGLPNSKLVNNFPQYIVGVASGYLIGEPVQYSAREDITVLTDAYSNCNIDNVDGELAENASVYGVGVEIVYADDKGRPKSASLDRKSAFVVYDDTVEHNPIAGIRWIISEKNGVQTYRLWWYDDKKIREYIGTGIDGLALVKETPHYFGAVPIVEYWNNSTEQGDFEPVMSLIDAYNLLESDRINDKQQFVDSLLVMYGADGIAPPDDENDKRSVAQRLKEDKILAMPEGARSEYLYKQLNESDVEILRKALKDDIHKFSRIPDLSDEHFAGNASGVAMKYKLFGLEQLTKMKERWFEEGLRCRLKLFCEFLRIKGMGVIDYECINISFSRSLPSNELEVAQTIVTLRGLVPDELLLGQVPFISDVDAAQELLNEQSEKKAEQNSDMFMK